VAVLAIEEVSDRIKIPLEISLKSFRDMFH
jgi:hypothetical protein